MINKIIFVTKVTPVIESIARVHCYKRHSKIIIILYKRINKNMELRMWFIINVETTLYHHDGFLYSMICILL